MTTNTPAPKKARHVRTPAQIAQDTLADAEKKHAKAKANCDRLKTLAEEAEQAYQDAIAEQATTEEELAWARKNPRLPRQTGTDAKSGGTITVGGTS